MNQLKNPSLFLNMDASTNYYLILSTIRLSRTYYAHCLTPKFDPEQCLALSPSLSPSVCMFHILSNYKYAIMAITNTCLL